MCCFRCKLCNTIYPKQADLTYHIENECELAKAVQAGIPIDGSEPRRPAAASASTADADADGAKLKLEVGALKFGDRVSLSPPLVPTNGNSPPPPSAVSPNGIGQGDPNGNSDSANFALSSRKFPTTSMLPPSDGNDFFHRRGMLLRRMSVNDALAAAKFAAEVERDLDGRDQLQRRQSLLFPIAKQEGLFVCSCQCSRR